MSYRNKADEKKWQHDYYLKNKWRWKGYYKKQREDPERLKLQSARARKCHLKRKWGMTPEEYENVLVSQGGVCAICGNGSIRDGHHTFHIDHDHETGRIRGLLCYSCNCAIGHFHDDQSLMKLAIEYLSDRG